MPTALPPARTVPTTKAANAAASPSRSIREPYDAARFYNRLVPPADTKESFLPHRSRRPRIESLFVRLVATGGVIGAGVALAAILGSQDVEAWIIGLAVSIVTVLLSALLWSSRTL